MFAALFPILFMAILPLRAQILNDVPGAEGIRLGRFIGLRDMVESGLYSRGVYGNGRALVMSDLLARQDLFEIDAPEDQLARKLQDLNDAAPSLGSFFLLAFLNHTFEFVQEPWPDPAPEESSPSLPGERVQISVHRGTRVLIHEDSWNRLSTDDQVALLIHEMALSLAIPKPINGRPGVRAPSAAKIREVVAAMFSRDLLTQGPDLVRRVIEPELEIAIDWTEKPGEFRQPVRFEILDVGVQPPKPLGSTEHGTLYTTTQIESSVRMICTNGLRQANTRRIEIRARIQPPGFKAVFVSERGPAGPAKRLTIVRAPTPERTHVERQPRSVKKCAESLTDFVRAFLDEFWSPPGNAPGN